MRTPFPGYPSRPSELAVRVCSPSRLQSRLSESVVRVGCPGRLSESAVRVGCPSHLGSVCDQGALGVGPEAGRLSESAEPLWSRPFEFSHPSRAIRVTPSEPPVDPTRSSESFFRVAPSESPIRAQVPGHPEALCLVTAVARLVAGKPSRDSWQASRR